jgi:hypothetical protein
VLAAAPQILNGGSVLYSVHGPRSGGQSASDSQTTQPSALQISSERHDTIPIASVMVAQQVSPSGHPAGVVQSVSGFSQPMVWKSAGAMHEKYGVIFVTQQTRLSAHSSVPHSNGPSGAPSGPASFEETNSHWWLVPPRQQPPIASAIKPIAHATRQSTRTMPTPV